MQRLITIGTSAGGVDTLATIVNDLPAGLDAAVLIVLHVGAHPSVLPTLLGRRSRLPVRHAAHDEQLQAGTILVAPPDHHLLVDTAGGHARVQLSHGPKENHARPAIDPLFRSAAQAFGSSVIGVVLTGFLEDGSAGLHAIKECGGVAIVQDPDDAFAADMPQNALSRVKVDFRLPAARIGATLTELVRDTGVPSPMKQPAPDWIAFENRALAGGADMADLQKIATPSGYTCPDCGGAMFKLKAQPFDRFRCHTGHSYTLDGLLQMQSKSFEESIWSAVRSLQEREQVARHMLTQAEADGDRAGVTMYRELLEKTLE
ncbi:MAG: chemotaxis protein CheB [Gammaproteobacteria bacterium]